MSDKKPYHVTFICTGNVCRSPFAEGSMRFVARQEAWLDLIEVTSGGELDLHGAPADTLMVAEGGRRGFDLTRHRSRQVDFEYLNSCDLILCLAAGHAALLKRCHPSISDRVYQLGLYPEAGTNPEADIADPIGKDEKFFNEVCDQMEMHIFRVCAELKHKLTQSQA